MLFTSQDTEIHALRLLQASPFISPLQQRRSDTNSTERHPSSLHDSNSTSGLRGVDAPIRTNDASLSANNTRLQSQHIRSDITRQTRHPSRRSGEADGRSGGVGDEINRGRRDAEKETAGAGAAKDGCEGGGGEVDGAELGQD